MRKNPHQHDCPASGCPHSYSYSYSYSGVQRSETRGEAPDKRGTTDPASSRLFYGVRRTSRADLKKSATACQTGLLGGPSRAGRSPATWYTSTTSNTVHGFFRFCGSGRMQACIQTEVFR